jgi:hypothetical protein
MIDLKFPLCNKGFLVLSQSILAKLVVLRVLVSAKLDIDLYEDPEEKDY